MIRTPKIIIIGAGAAGIAAASRLIEGGLDNVTILEGKDRIGGRIHTVEFCKLNTCYSNLKQCFTIYKIVQYIISY